MISSRCYVLDLSLLCLLALTLDFLHTKCESTFLAADVEPRPYATVVTFRSVHTSITLGISGCLTNNFGGGEIKDKFVHVTTLIRSYYSLAFVNNYSCTTNLHLHPCEQEIFFSKPTPIIK